MHAAENLHRAGLARIYACGHDGVVSARRVHETTSMAEAGSQRGVMITIAHPGKVEEYVWSEGSVIYACQLIRYRSQYLFLDRGDCGHSLLDSA